MRMVQRRHGSGFALEPCTRVLPFGDVIGQDLDCDRAVKPCISSFVHFAHPGSDPRVHGTGNQQEYKVMGIRMSTKLSRPSPGRSERLPFGSESLANRAFKTAKTRGMAPAL